MSASPPWPRWSGTPSRPRASMTWRPGPGSWAGRASAVRVVDGDLGISGSVTGQRDGFEGLVAEVALGQVGIVLALEVSRLARDNAAWYRLLDLAGVCDTLVADGDGVYHPALFNDRLLLGMKGIMSEAELHVLRARLNGGVRNKAARGELRRGLPVGLVWGEADGEIVFHPDEAVTGVIAAVFSQFAVCGSVRATWLWLRGQGLRWPLQKIAYTRRGSGLPEITWVEPTYHAVHTTLSHPAYAGAYVYGRTRKERYLDPGGTLRQRSRGCPATSGRSSSPITIPGSPTGTPTWPTRPASAPISGRRPASRAPARSGKAARCCRAWPPAGPAAASSRSSTPARQSRAELLLPGLRRAGRRPRRPAHERRRAGHRRRRRRRVPGRARARRAQACLTAARQLEDGHDAALAQHRRQVEQARYHASRAERRYRAVDPDNRLVARGLETEWEHALRELADAEAELARRETARPKTLTARRTRRDPGPRRRPRRGLGRAHHHQTRTASSCCAPCSTK